MNLNKKLPDGMVFLVLSVLFLIASVYLLVSGLISVKSDDGSGLGSFLGQGTVFLTALAFLMTIATAAIGLTRFKSPRKTKSKTRSKKN